MKISSIFKSRNDLNKPKVQIYYGKKKAPRNDFSKVLEECMVTLDK